MKFMDTFFSMDFMSTRMCSMKMKRR